MTVVPLDIAEGCGCDIGQDAGAITLGEALERIERRIAPVDGDETIALDRAGGRVLTAPVHAHSDMPRFDHAAMDGYAVGRDNLTGDGPWRLPVSARHAAGDAVGKPLAPGTASRIFTGAPVPAGADCVVMQEMVRPEGGAIRLEARPQRGENIRFRGEENRIGDGLLGVGDRLTPRAMAACASGGAGMVVVRRSVRVSLLVSGSEVAQAGTADLPDARIWDVNTPMLRAALERPDVDVICVGKMDDDLVKIRHAVAEAAERSDLVVTTGGVSVGEEDHLNAAIGQIGGKSLFAGVAIKPGKPVACARLGQAIWLGLPGNPLSAFVTWTLFGEAILGRLTGCRDRVGRRQNAVLNHTIRRRPGRREIRPAILLGRDAAGRDMIDCSRPVASGRVGALARADGLAILPADADCLAEGTGVEFLPFCQT